jgi:hypothetical protein
LRRATAPTTLRLAPSALWLLPTVRHHVLECHRSTCAAAIDGAAAPFNPSSRGIWSRIRAERADNGTLVSEAPSYHSATSYHQHEPVPAYTPREPRARSNTSSQTNSNSSRAHSSSAPANQPAQHGLPPVTSTPQVGLPSIHSFRIPRWSTYTAPPSRQLHSVVERRVNASLEATSAAAAAAHRRAMSGAQPSSPGPISRPLEDPYLVGEEAASRAKQERLARERAGDDVLVRENQHWDWLLGMSS